MKIWLLQIGEPLPIGETVRKMRTALLADTLSTRGHEVVWWASSFDHVSKKMLFVGDEEIIVNPNYRIRTFKGIAYNKNISIRRYLDHVIVARKFKRAMQGERKPDIIVASMPDYFTAYEGVVYARKNSVPVLVDVRDEWPDLFLEVLPHHLRIAARFLLWKDFAKVRNLLQNADGLISMMDQLLVWGLKKAGREAAWTDRVFYLGAPRVSKDSGKEVSDKFAGLSRRAKGKFVITYIGTFGKYYNPVVIIRAAEILGSTKATEDLLFVIAGDGKYFNEVKKAAQNRGNIIIPGWINQEEINYLLSISSVGIIPCSEDISAFPNKAFTYLSAGLPVLSSVNGELKDLIQKHRFGLHFKPNDYHALAQLIAELYLKKETHSAMARKSNEMFSLLFDAEKVYEKFANHIEEVARGKGKRET